MPPRLNIFNVLTGPEGEDLLEGFAARVYAKGALVCTGDLDENGVFIVASGQLRVFMIGEDNEITLFYLGPGDMFSMHSGCQIEACEASDLWVTDLPTFQRKMAAYPRLADSLVSILGRAMTSCIRTIQDLAFHDIRQRLLRFFLDYAQTEGRKVEQGIEIKLPLTVEQIALLIGSGRQATSTTIGCLVREGVMIRLSRGHYIFPDLSRLTASAEAQPGRKRES